MYTHMFQILCIDHNLPESTATGLWGPKLWNENKFIFHTWNNSICRTLVLKEKAYPLLLCISVSAYGNPPWDVEYTY